MSPPGDQTRPITGYVKKSLFDTIRPRLDSACVLDLYCGTGTLGIEALSNGADHVYFAERHRGTLSRLKANIETCRLSAASTIWAGDIVPTLRNRLPHLENPADIIFLDPPFAASAGWDHEEMSRMVFIPLSKAASRDALAVLRIRAGTPPPRRLGDLHRSGIRDYNDMALIFYRRADAR